MASYTDRIILLDASGKQTLAHSSDSIIVSSSLTVNGTLVIGGGLVSNLISKTANYTIQSSDYIISIGTLSGSITITLPSSPSNGETHIIADSNGSAAAHQITINGGGHNIAGSSTYNIDIRYESITIVYDNTISVWVII